MAKPNSSTITAKRARELLRYDPETGKLFWRKPACHGQITAGTEAGGINVWGYRRVYIDGCRYLSHRLAWLIVTGAWPTEEIDHINGDKLDNRWSNLREVSRRENLRNAKRYSNNMSGVVGVYWYGRCNKWKAQICVNGLSIHLGYFDSLPAAIAVRRSAERQHGFHENHGRAS